MNRYIRYAAIVGSCLLGSACEQGTAPDPSTFIPKATFVQASTVKLDTRIGGLAWDGEAFFLALVGCGPPGVCPFPPFISEGLPHFARAALMGTAIQAWDPLMDQPSDAKAAAVGAVFGSAPNGYFELEGVPSRADVPFYLYAAGQGTFAPPNPNAPPPPNPQIAPTTYLPTVNTRPINTMFSTCTSQEAVLIGRNGVLEAVAKHLTSQGRPTQVQDFINPSVYHSVAVVATHHAGNQAVRAPANGISLEGTQGEVYVIDWAPLPADALRSARGFIVTNAATSPVGFNVVLMRATSQRPATITYRFSDTVEDSVSRRPWVFPEIKEPPHSGVITYIGAQMRYKPADNIPRSSLGIPPAACIPGVL